MKTNGIKEKERKYLREIVGENGQKPHFFTPAFITREGLKASRERARRQVQEMREQARKPMDISLFGDLSFLPRGVFF